MVVVVVGGGVDAVAVVLIVLCYAVPFLLCLYLCRLPTAWQVPFSHRKHVLLLLLRLFCCTYGGDACAGGGNNVLPHVAFAVAGSHGLSPSEHFHFP